MDDEDGELRNPFPSPPSHYANYTAQNLRLLGLLRSRLSGQPTDEPISLDDQRSALQDQKEVPEWPLTQLEKPRVDWILEEGSYTVFGDTWFVKEKIPPLEESGVLQLYPSDPSVDRRPALHSILRSLLAGYLDLLSSTTAPPPVGSNPAEPEWVRLIEWMNLAGQNMLAAANDLRPVQARVSLEIMMRRQLELRRAETQAIHGKCDALETQLAELKARASAVLEKRPPFSRQASEQDVPMDFETFGMPQHVQGASFPLGQTLVPTVNGTEDVLRWAEEPG